MSAGAEKNKPETVEHPFTLCVRGLETKKGLCLLLAAYATAAGKNNDQ